MTRPPPDETSSGGIASEPADLEGVVDGITAFVTDHVDAADRDGVVVEVSGGLNSAVATMLAVDAIGADRVFGLLLPAYMHAEADTHVAELVAKGLGIEYEKVQLLPFVHLFQELSVPTSDRPDDVRATTNAVDRIRMACAYYAANATDRLVLGTEDRTEWLLGTVTKYGVRRGDLMPLGHLYSTEVRTLADAIGIPDGICDDADRGRRHSVAATLDVDPGTLDAVLHSLVDEDEGIERTAADLGVDEEVIRRCAVRHVRSRHKRQLPPTPASVGEGAYERFHEIELRFD